MYDHDPSARLDVEVVLHGVVVAHGRADRFRKDVKDAGYGDGGSGFHIPMPAALASQDLSEVVVRPRGVEAYLIQPRKKLAQPPAQPPMAEPPRPPAAPVSERPPSLWVDRPDWFEILCARHRRGQLSDEVADQIARFVRDGILVVRRALSPWLADLVDRAIEAARQTPPDGLRQEYETADGRYEVVRAAPGPLPADGTLVDLHAFSAAVRTALAAPGAVAFLTGLFAETPMLAGLRTLPALSARDAARRLDSPEALGAFVLLGRRGEGQGDLGYHLGSHRATTSGDAPANLSGFPLRRLAAERGDLVIWHPDLVLADEDAPEGVSTGPALLASFAPVSAAVAMKARAYPMQESHGCQFVSQYHPIRTLL